jgi:hypothetical protein
MATHALSNVTRLVDANEVRRALQLLAEPNQVVEVRALDASLDQNGRYTRTYGGYFDNPNDLIKSISTIRFAMGIYITLHPCHKDLLHKAKNKLVEQKSGSSTPDKYITSYRWLAIDCDPERVAGISSTNEEHEKALAMCRKIREALSALGWPEPILADSGNGGHLLYRVDLPISDKNLIERVLKGLAQFDEESVHVDQTMFNPSRIIKLYGTLACKGDNTDERPHRLSRILEVPEQLQIVSRELLEAMAVPAEEKAAIEPNRVQNNGYKSNGYVKEDFTLDAFIAKHGIKVKSKSPYQSGTRYLLEGCVWDPSHTDNSACLFDMPNGLGASCSHNSCQGKHWRDFRLHFEPDAYTPKVQTKQRKTAKNSDAEQDQGLVKEETALTRLMRIADQAHLICTPSGALYARVPINSHYEIVSIDEKGSGFRRWLVHKFKSEYGFAPNSDALSQTMSGVQADAEFIGEKAEIYTRIAEKNGCIYLDLANDKWQCVEISTDGWRVITCPPVYFRRPSGMLPLPVPTTGGSLDELRELINAKDERDYKLITAWLVGTLHPKGPYPVLCLNGERGSAKTKGTIILRNLVDPNLAPARNAPKDDRGAAITAQNNMVIALDNLSSMPMWLSDLLCRIATGSGHAERELYSNSGEIVFNERRPIIMNGIEDGIVSQGDLLNRTIMVTLTPPDEYMAEEDLDELFREKHPSILGALLTVASVALRDRRRVRLDNTPRMADFAKWLTAAEPVLGWEQGTFMDIYAENQASATSIVMEASPVAKAIVQFMDSNKRLTGKDEWKGLVKDLHIELTKYDVYKDNKTAPKSANKLSGQIKRIKSSLYIQGIDIELKPRTGAGVPVTLRMIPGSDHDDKHNLSGNLSGVDRISVSVDKPPVSVDKPPVSVDKNQVSTPLIKANCELTGVSESHFSVDSVDTLPSLSSLYPPFDEEKREEIESVRERADREEILSTLSTLPTLPLSDAAIPDEFTYEDEGCSTCGCGLTRPLAGNPVCVRCLPPKGYSAYSHLVDEMFPRKQKVEFSKGGNRG